MAITAGLTIPCEARSGGLKELYFANKADVTSFTLSAEKYIAVVMVAGKIFYKFEFEQLTAERRENGSRANGSTKVEHEIEFLLPKLTSTNRNAIQALLDACCGLICIAVDANNLKWVVGYSETFTTTMPLKTSSDATKSGKNFTDLNGSVIILKSEDTSKDVEFTGSIPLT